MKYHYDDMHKTKKEHYDLWTLNVDIKSLNIYVAFEVFICI